ncbi:MAG TPA: FmdB family zinc ribbon protein [Micromonosporaceae bacterium]|nr:FmdB family zinc ribbon protein [Micromonosporaceae bacterium]
MPTYQYACTACGHQLEAVQSFVDEPLTECPACEGRLRKLFGSVGIVFKGAGFYRTDSRSSGSGSTDKSDGNSTKTDKACSDGAASNGGKASSSTTGAGSTSGGSAGSASTSTTKAA